jgi:hypothetical protein
MAISNLENRKLWDIIEMKHSAKYQIYMTG